MAETPTATVMEAEGGEAALLRLIEAQRTLIASLRSEKEEVAGLLTEQIEKLRSQVE